MGAPILSSLMREPIFWGFKSLFFCNLCRFKRFIGGFKRFQDGLFEIFYHGKKFDFAATRQVFFPFQTLFGGQGGNRTACGGLAFCRQRLFCRRSGNRSMDRAPAMGFLLLLNSDVLAGLYFYIYLTKALTP